MRIQFQFQATKKPSDPDWNHWFVGRVGNGTYLMVTIIEVDELEVTLSREQERAARAQDSLATTRTHLTQVRQPARPLPY